MTYAWDADFDENEEQEQERVGEADAYYGNDGEWDDDFPQDDVDVEEQFRSL